MAAPPHDPVRWFREHYEDAPAQILDLLAADGFSLEGKDVADVGCGDGVIDLGVVHRGRPAMLVGYDIRPVDIEGLVAAATAAGIEQPLPDNLNFMVSEADRIPAVNDSFDIVYSWSVFEHVDKPVQMLSEIRRILRPDGVLFLQLWPFFYSQHGGHLWPHYDEGFPHLRRRTEAVLEDVGLAFGTDPTRSADDEYRSLNRLTLDGLQLALLAAGFQIGRAELITNTLHLDRELMRYRLSDLLIGGVKLLASPAPLA